MGEPQKAKDTRNASHHKHETDRMRCWSFFIFLYDILYIVVHDSITIEHFKRTVTNRWMYWQVLF